MNSNRNKIIESIIKNGYLTSGLILEFERHMIESVDDWINFEYKDWISCLEMIKNESFKLYAFLPFVHRVLGIRLLEEFGQMDSISNRVRNYVGDCKGIPIATIRASNLNFYREKRDTIDRLYHYRSELIRQGASPVTEYTVHAEKYIRRYSKYIKFRRRIGRDEFTKIAIEDLCQDEYIYEEIDLRDYN